MGLIDRDALIKQIERTYCDPCTDRKCLYGGCHLELALDAIENAPEVKAVTEIRHIGAYRVRSEKTLLREKKSRLVDTIRLLEYNWASAEARIAQQYENVKDWEPVKHGHWNDSKHLPVTCDRYGDAYDIYCSVCGNWYVGSDEYCVDSNYCPHCGAIMDEVEE